MIDPFAAAMAALTSRSPAAFAAVFLAGALTSVGPCVAPRFIAIAAILNGDRRPALSTLAFGFGLVGAFASLGFVGGLLGALWSLSSTIYLMLAAGLVAAGGIMLVRAEPCAHADRARAAGARAAEPRSLGAVFFLGAASTLVVSPCCTPIVAVAVATTSAIGKPLLGAALLASYGAGHALPLVFAAKISAGMSRFAPRGGLGQAPAIVGAVLLLALGVYYGVLA
jgi:cytochrome c-type biogenesis protein